MNGDRPANEPDVTIVGGLLGMRAGKDIIDFMSHGTEVFPQSHGMMVYPTWIGEIIGRNVYNFHRISVTAVITTDRFSLLVQDTSNNTLLPTDLARRTKKCREIHFRDNGLLPVRLSSLCSV